MNFEFYKVLHIICVFILLSSLAVIYTMYSRKELNFKNRSRFLAAHGLCLILIFISGFGMLAKLGLTKGFPLWAYGKMLIWLAIGIMPAFAKRFQKYAYSLWFLTMSLAAFAVILAVYHL